MLRPLLARSLAVVGIVGATSLGLVVTTAGTAQAVEWGPADRLMVKVVTGAVTGASATSSPILIRSAVQQEAKCTGAGPEAPACLALTTAGVALIGGALLTKDIWVPWLRNAAGLDGGGDTSSSANVCGSNVMCIPGGTIEFASPPVRTSDGNTLRTLPYTMRFTVTDSRVLGDTIAIQMKCKGSNGIVSDWRTQVEVRAGDYAGGRTSGTWDYPGFGASCNYGEIITDLRWSPYNNVRVSPSDDTRVVWTNKIAWNENGSTFGTGATINRTSCQRPDGTMYEVTTSDIPRDGYVKINHCDPGDTPTEIGIKKQGSSDPETVTNLRRDDPTAARQYPLCAGAACIYSISIDGQPCVVGDAECADWTRVNRQTPDRVECHWGPYKIDTDLCYWLENVYTTGTADKIATIPNTDGDPDTKGEVTYPRPSPSTSTTATTSPSPTVTVTPSPSVTTPKVPLPVENCVNGSSLCTPKINPENPNGASQCWPNGWGALNPFNWVQQPVQCAMKWAFVPPPGSIDGLKTQVMDDWNGSTPGRWVGGLPAIWTGFGGHTHGGSGCKGPGLPTGFLSTSTHGSIASTIYPFDACSGPKAYAAQVVHAAQSFALSFFGGLRAVQLLGSGFGFVIPSAYAYRDYTDNDLKGAWS